MASPFHVILGLWMVHRVDACIEGQRVVVALRECSRTGSRSHEMRGAFSAQQWFLLARKSPRHDMLVTVARRAGVSISFEMPVSFTRGQRHPLVLSKSRRSIRRSA